MIQFFNQVVDNRIKGSSAYLESMQRVFAQDGGSGLIEVQYSSTDQLVFVYLDGQAISVYHLGTSQCRLIPEDEVRLVWPDGEADLRAVPVPSQGLRLAVQALEWCPPQQERALEGDGAGRYLEDLKMQKQDGLLRVKLPDLDGFAVLLDGDTPVSDAVFSTPRGIESMALNLPQWTGKLRGQCQLVWYAARPESASYQRLLLRNAVTQWVEKVILGYQHLVGRNLVNSLDYEVNTALRLRRWNLRLVGGGLVDHHFFLDATMAVQVYQTVLGILNEQMVRVVGKSLTQRAVSQAFAKLKDRQRQTLIEHSLISFATEKPAFE
ncbi:MAG: hypothetical protein AB1894_06415 [Chloroflexota bacterium]